MMWFGHGLGWGLFGWIIMVAFWGGLFVLTLLVARTIFDAPHHKEDPLDILNTRYARGEITREEYDVIKRTLGEHHA